MVYARPVGGGWCTRLHLREDNARFVLLAIVLVMYMCFGASIFMLLEQDKEIEDRDTYYKTKSAFIEMYPFVNETDLENLLSMHADASAAGLLEGKRPRWDFAGSFYFVGTVVSTIGFGMTTPRTTEGQVVLIFYGVLGCAGGILFFNLFLERIITFLAYILRAIHELDMRRKGLKNSDKDRESVGSSDDDLSSLDSWKPSVYWVMLILLISAIIIACCASAMYHPVEDWTYFESMYFCFVAFATIGFGDYVVSQKSDYSNVHLYRLGNFFFLVIGCCCIYSLFNVTSIVIKQVLNCIIRKLDCQCCYRTSAQPRARRNAITPNHWHKRSTATAAPATQAPDLIDIEDSDSNYDSESQSHRGSAEMISMKDFLQTNHIALAMMQKQLYETAQRGLRASRAQDDGAFHGGVGPLAILNKKLGQDDL